MKRKPPDDAYGQLLWDFHQGQETVEIVERDDGFIGTGKLGPKAYFAKFDKWPSDERAAMEFVNGRVLDIGCGVGRHALHLQQRGHDITGIDSSPLAIRVCRLRGLRKARVLPFAEIRKFRPGSFDSVIMMGNNFGLFGSFGKARRLLTDLHRITSVKARIIAQTTDPYGTVHPDHLSYQAFNRRRGRMPGQLRIRIRYKKLQGFWFDYLLVSKAELQQILDGTAWEARRFLKSRQVPSRYIMVLEKRLEPS